MKNLSKFIIICAIICLQSCGTESNDSGDDSTVSISNYNQSEEPYNPESTYYTYDGPVGSLNFSIPEPIYTITQGQQFDATKDIEFTILDENNTDFSDDALISGDYDINTIGNYTITISYEALEKEIILIVEKGYTLGEYWLDIHSDNYRIVKGDSFNPKEDIKFEAKDKEGNNASDSVIFSNDFNVDFPGFYTITLTYETETAEITLVVTNDEEGEDPLYAQTPMYHDFIITMKHEYKVNDTLIIIEAGKILEKPNLIIKTIYGKDAKIAFFDGSEIIGTSPEIGTDKLRWGIEDPDDSTIWAIYDITVNVIDTSETPLLQE